MTDAQFRTVMNSVLAVIVEAGAILALISAAIMILPLTAIARMSDMLIGTAAACIAVLLCVPVVCVYLVLRDSRPGQEPSQ